MTGTSTAGPSAPSDPTESRAHVRGAELAYTDAGAGPLAVYAHGLTQSRASETASGLFDWAPVVAAGRRLVRYDARGHGQSTGEAIPAQYAWPQLADDLLALLDQLAGAAPVAGIGSSMGTATLLHAAVRAPGRFDRLVLTAPPTAWASREAQAGLYRQGADLVETRGPGLFAELAASAPVPAVFADLPGYPPAPDVSEKLFPSVLRGAADSDLPPEAALATIDVPVLILAWAGDPGHPLSTAERLAALIDGARLQVAETGAQLARWGALTAEFLGSGEQARGAGGA
ncbi:alpha/beta fold hydrolase [Frankia sp. QA3]|uniref:alpha/beta fold hydrolase n=1 Tax=Frankia sp. QA3 TaxID=710111 RepID=UPI000269C032|nr:alpha/beta hydrolase [Frankia sp. QA3]EIV91570.1 putative hydrolase or acyltransferase of alpha/beta superfamily [Frankia sp. QA3]